MKTSRSCVLLLLVACWVAGLPGSVLAATYSGPGLGRSAPTLTRYNAPTANLTLVANAVQLRAKSLTTLAVIPAGLKLSNPVQVSIGYYSPAGSSRITQNYVASSGNRFLYNDKESDGRPRAMRLDVSLLESNPNGVPFTFSFAINVNLDPLYDVQVSPLRFTLLKECASFGDSDIKFMWHTPDTPPQIQTGRSRDFSTSANKLVVINEFAWVGREISASMDRREPVAWFHHRAFSMDFQRLGQNVSEVKLVPGQTKKVQRLLNEVRTGGTTLPGCFANVEYTMGYTLRWYAEL